MKEVKGEEGGREEEDRKERMDLRGEEEEVCMTIGKVAEG